jgi:acetolactate synthase-1/3 small subunit
MKQVLSVIVENEAGVLSKITGLFSRRGFNIDSLAVGPTEDPTMSRITMIVDNGNSAIEQVEKQLNKLIGVIKIKRIEAGELSGKELMLIKVAANSKTRIEIKTLCDIMDAKIDDISATTITIALADSPEKTALFQDMMRPFGILEVARTGLIAIQKGAKKITE